MPIAGTGEGGAAAGDLEDATPRALAAVTAALGRLVARNEEIVQAEAEDRHDEGGAAAPPAAAEGGLLDAFRGARAPSISLGKYVKRIYRYTGCSPSCFVVGFVYVDRLAHRHPSSLLVSANVHRLVLTSVMVASKVIDDVHHNNAFYAKVGGVSRGDLNRMELELLFLLDFGVMVTSHVFESYCLCLEKELLLCGGGGGGSAACERRSGSEGNHVVADGNGGGEAPPGAASEAECAGPGALPCRRASSSSLLSF